MFIVKLLLIASWVLTGLVFLPMKYPILAEGAFFFGNNNVSWGFLLTFVIAGLAFFGLNSK